MFITLTSIFYKMTTTHFLTTPLGPPVHWYSR